MGLRLSTGATARAGTKEASLPRTKSKAPRNILCWTCVGECYLLAVMEAVCMQVQRHLRQTPPPPTHPPPTHPSACVSTHKEAFIALCGCGPAACR